MAYARSTDEPDVIIDYAPAPTGGWQYKPQYYNVGGSADFDETTGLYRSTGTQYPPVRKGGITLPYMRSNRGSVPSVVSTPPVVVTETQPQPQPQQSSTWLYVAIGAAALYFLTKK